MHPTKINEVKTTLGYKKELMRQSIGTTNLQKIFVACFGHEIFLKVLLTAAIYICTFFQKMTSRISLSTCTTILDYVLCSLKS